MFIFLSFKSASFSASLLQTVLLLDSGSLYKSFLQKYCISFFRAFGMIAGFCACEFYEASGLLSMKHSGLLRSIQRLAALNRQHDGRRKTDAMKLCRSTSWSCTLGMAQMQHFKLCLNVLIMEQLQDQCLCL